MAALPETIGDYKVIRELGRGGMGVVYLCVHPSLGRELAIKVMARELGYDPEFLERFRREGEAAAKLRHPNIVQVFDFANRDGLYFIAMEYLGARTLKDLLVEEGHLTVSASCQFMDELLSALHLAHTKGIVHRDVKPANVMVTDEGAVALTDFSVAHMKDASKLTQTGAIVGTPEYMAPEQFDGNWDARSDVYAAGILFYELLTGLSPFRSATMTEVLRKQLLSVPDPPSRVDVTVPEPVSLVVTRALEKDPENRFQSALDMRQAIAKALSGCATSGETASSPALTARVPALETAIPPVEEVDVAGLAASQDEQPPPLPAAIPPLRVTRVPVEAAPPEAVAISVLSAASLPALVSPPVPLPSPIRQATSPKAPRKELSPAVRGLAMAAIMVAGGLAAVAWKNSASDIAPQPAPSSQSPQRFSPSPRPRPAAPKPVADSPKSRPSAAVRPPAPQGDFPAKAPITPGVGVGQVQVGIGKAKVRKLWGPPSQGVSEKGLTRWDYGGPNPRVAVFFDLKNRVMLVAVNSPEYPVAGAEQCRVGADLDSVAYHFPNPTYGTDTHLTYDDQGLLFSFQDGVCAQILVFGRGRAQAVGQLLNR